LWMGMVMETARARAMAMETGKSMWEVVWK
jgi:hypothetical protein